MRPVSEQTVLITGATDGLGRGRAAELAAEGARLLIHGRDDDRGRETIDEIHARTGNENLRWLRADLAAATGTRLRFAVNYLAGYLLTRLLLPLLEASTPARIVNVSSAGQAPIDFDDVMLERRYVGVQAYCQSKLAQIMFTFDLADELRDRGVTATCLHPATYMPTKMVRASGINPTSSLEDGVRATLRLVAAPELDGVSGRYFNGLRPAEPHRQARDPDARRRLRELSDRLCGRNDEGPPKRAS